jgi:sugar transferase (PEP-CTERM system associated)
LIRLFNVYYPIRTLVLVTGDAMMVWVSLLLGTVLQYREDAYLVLNFEYGYYKIIAVTLFVLLVGHWLDLYDLASFDSKDELYFRILLVPGLLALLIAIIGSLFPKFLLGKHAFLFGLAILTLALFAWRSAYVWIAENPYLRERVYVLGTGERAKRLVTGLAERTELGIDVVGWSGEVEGDLTRENISSHLLAIVRERKVHRIIVAMQDRRHTLPMSDLLQLRLEQSVQIEDSTTWLEKISGKIEVDQLHPSWIVFAQGFRFSGSFRFVQRILNFLAGLTSLLLSTPLIPFILIAIKSDSSGPVLYRQKRVGRGGRIFTCYKFRTMRPDAEADIGPTWADDDDPRITRVGRFLRLMRLDEIPQLWCVLKGDMAFVGPRPERPEFVEWLTTEIPFYNVRHIIRPGITGWAQIRYKYGNSIRDAKEKLQYDLFYIKNASVGLDIFIMFQTIKILLLRRGAQ